MRELITPHGTLHLRREEAPRTLPWRWNGGFHGIHEDSSHGEESKGKSDHPFPAFTESLVVSFEQRGVFGQHLFHTPYFCDEWASGDDDIDRSNAMLYNDCCWKSTTSSSPHQGPRRERGILLVFRTVPNANPQIPDRASLHINSISEQNHQVWLDPDEFRLCPTRTGCTKVPPSRRSSTIHILQRPRN